MVMTLEEKSALLEYLKQKEDRSAYETNLMNLLAYHFLLIRNAEKMLAGTPGAALDPEPEKIDKNFSYWEDEDASKATD